LIEKTFNSNRNSKNETTNQNKNTNIYDPSSKTMLQRYLSQKKGDKYNIKLASFLHFFIIEDGLLSSSAMPYYFRNIQTNFFEYLYAKSTV